MAAARPASPPADPAFHDYFLITSHPDRREITCYSILYPLPRELNQFCAHFLASLRTPRAAFCEETLFTTLLSPEPWHPRVTIATPPDHPIPEPVGNLTPLIPHRHFLTRRNHEPEFTTQLVMPQSPPHGYTHRHLRTLSPLDLDRQSYSSFSSNELFNLVLAISPAASLTPPSTIMPTLHHLLQPRHLTLPIPLPIPPVPITIPTNPSGFPLHYSFSIPTPAYAQLPIDNPGQITESLGQNVVTLI